MRRDHVYARKCHGAHLDAEDHAVRAKVIEVAIGVFQHEHVHRVVRKKLKELVPAVHKRHVLARNCAVATDNSKVKVAVCGLTAKAGGAFSRTPSCRHPHAPCPSTQRSMYKCVKKSPCHRPTHQTPHRADGSSSVRGCLGTDPASSSSMAGLFPSRLCLEALQ